MIEEAILKGVVRDLLCGLGNAAARCAAWPPACEACRPPAGPERRSWATAGSSSGWEAAEAAAGPSPGASAGEAFRAVRFERSGRHPEAVVRRHLEAVVRQHPEEAVHRHQEVLLEGAFRADPGVAFPEAQEAAACSL